MTNQHYDWPTPLDRWNAMNRHYLEWIAANPERGIAVRSEDMMSPDDARRQYLRIGAHFGFAQRGEYVHVFRRRITPTQRIARREMNYAYYQDRRYLTQYTEEDWAAMLRAADPWVMAQLGYTALVDPPPPGAIAPGLRRDAVCSKPSSGSRGPPYSLSYTSSATRRRLPVSCIS